MSTPLLDYIDEQESRNRKEDGISTVLSHADDVYMQRFESEVKRLASTGIPFTSADITSIIGLPPGSRNVIGGLMHSLANKKIIKPTGRMVKNDRVLAHRRRVVEWIGGA